MPSYEFQDSILIKADADCIFQHLAEPQNYLGLQPFLVKVDELERGITAEGTAFRRYRTVEKLKMLGIIPYYNTIEVLLTLHPDEQRISSHVGGALKLNMTADMLLTPEVDGTRFTERIHISMTGLNIGFLRRFVVNNAEVAQRSRFEALRDRME